MANDPPTSHTRLIPEKRADLVAEYEAGVPVRPIAARFGVHRGTVSERVRRARVPVRESGPDAPVLVSAAAEYESGKPLAEVARQFGVSDETVQPN